MSNKKANEYWQSKLNPDVYHVMREKGTERPFTGKFNDHHETGSYVCAACGSKLFSSSHKFDAGCGWPSFYETASPQALTSIRDTSHGMIRTEVVCSECESHLGHVFNDGPAPTHLRYCINSLALDFSPQNTQE